MDRITTHVNDYHDYQWRITPKPERIPFVRAMFFALLWVMFSGGLIVLTEKNTSTNNRVTFEQNRMPPPMALHPFLYH